jgi:hypothetical protein
MTWEAKALAISLSPETRMALRLSPMVDARLLASAVGDHRLLQVSAGGTGRELAGPKFAPKLRTNKKYRVWIF